MDYRSIPDASADQVAAAHSATGQGSEMRRRRRGVPRQASVPISYLGHDWDATDEEVLAMNNQLSYGGIGTGQSNQASFVSQINANVGSLASQINANVGSLKDQTNTNVGSLKDQVNADIVYQNENTLVPRINTALTSNKSLANATLNDRIGTASQPDTVNLDTINRGIVWNVNFPSPAAYVSQVNDASHPSAQVSSSGSVYVSFINVSFTNVSFTPVNAPSAAANISWYPIDETNPVTLTFQQNVRLAGGDQHTPRQPRHHASRQKGGDQRLRDYRTGDRHRSDNRLAIKE